MDIGLPTPEIFCQKIAVTVLLKYSDMMIFCKDFPSLLKGVNVWMMLVAKCCLFDLAKKPNRAIPLFANIWNPISKIKVCSKI